jgi:flagellar L-ring protein precursor FlgH
MPAINMFTIARAMAAMIALALALPASGCANLDRLEEVGKPPRLSRIANPVHQPGYRPVSLPMPRAEKARHNPNSLWRSGSRSFFKDQRARKVGDILTVLVEITDRAKIDNQTKSNRVTSRNIGIDHLGGVETLAKKLLPGGADMSNLVGVNSTSDSAGSGSVNRSERLTTKIAAIITQKLPNGNFVIEGRQEVRVNNEVREMLVAGIVRPEDITASNLIHISKIAEARISYGGRGQISAAQRPPVGHQVLDVIMPF